MIKGLKNANYFGEKFKESFDPADQSNNKYWEKIGYRSLALSALFLIICIFSFIKVFNN